MINVMPRTDLLTGNNMCICNIVFVFTGIEKGHLHQRRTYTTLKSTTLLVVVLIAWCPSRECVCRRRRSWFGKQRGTLVGHDARTSTLTYYVILVHRRTFVCKMTLVIDRWWFQMKAYNIPWQWNRYVDFYGFNETTGRHFNVCVCVCEKSDRIT